MKKIIIPFLFLFASIIVVAQPTLDLGLKAGINNSKISFSVDDYSSESILKAHFGAFARVGWGRVFVQPEAYFSAKGGDISSNVFNTITAFDYNTLDVPALLGVKIIKGKVVDLHVTAGPLFSFITSSSINGSDEYTQEFFGDHYMGVQYGLGIDVWFLTFDARMEHGNSKLYSHPDLEGKNRTFMLSVGFKIL